ncbi:MAG: hypothetical protein R3229_08425 [Alphaproteobacteria bacterium]|nr:hypothetical protein [Alphaproteobacteria bacterium]
MGLVAVLAACSADNVHLQAEYNRSTYDFLNFTTYHSERDTKVVIHGNPFAMEPAAFAQSVTGAMQGAHFGRRTNFTTTPGATAEPNMMVVMAFDADVGVYELCRGRPVRSHAPGDHLTLTAAWCFDGREDSTVYARVGRPANIDDPRFRALVRQTVLNLFPPHKRREFRDDNDRERRHK